MLLRVRFSSQRTLFSQFICWWTNSDFSHVEFVTPNGTVLGSRIFTGVAETEPAKYYKVADVTLDVPISVYFEALDKIGSNYDWVSLLAYPLRVKAQKSSWFTCVEYVASVLKEQGIIDIPRASTLTPGCLFCILTNCKHKVD